MHRGLKPENLALDERGTLKIIDFCRAACFTSGTLFTDFACSIEYAAPEIVNLQPYDGVKADVWSVGVILFEMVVGDIPFHFNDTDLSSEEYDFAFPNDIEGCFSDKLDSALRSILCQDPSQRASLLAFQRSQWMSPRTTDMVTMQGPDALMCRLRMARKLQLMREMGLCEDHKMTTA